MLKGRVKGRVRLNGPKDMTDIISAIAENPEGCSSCESLRAEIEALRGKVNADTELRELVLKTLDEDTNMRLELIRIKQKVRELIMELMLPHTMLPSEVGDRLQSILCGEADDAR